MAVVALLGSAVAATWRTTPARTLQAARATVEAQLLRARSHAIATGVPTALVFAGYEAPGGIAGKANVLVEAERDERAEAWRGRLQLSRWEILPGNAMFLDGSVTGTGATVMDGSPLIMLDCPDAGASGPFLVFGGNGALEWPPVGTPVSIAVGQATLRDGRLEISARGPRGQAVHDRMHVNRLSGRLRPAPNTGG